MAQTKREPEGYERLTAAPARLRRRRTRGAGEALPEIVVGALGRRGAEDGRGDPRDRRRSRPGRLAGARGAAVARAGVGSENRRRADSRAQDGRARRRRLGVRHAAHGRSRRLGGRRQSRRRRRALPARRSGAARRRRKLGRQPASVDAPRGAGLHPAVDQGAARSRAHARLGGAPRRRSPMVHPEGDRLVAARTLQARSRARAPLPRRTAARR